MNILQFLALNIVGSALKLSWFFFSEIQKDQTLKIIERELHDLLVEGGHSELASEVQELYIWLLEH